MESIAQPTPLPTPSMLILYALGDVNPRPRVYQLDHFTSAITFSFPNIIHTSCRIPPSITRTNRVHNVRNKVKKNITIFIQTI